VPAPTPTTTAINIAAAASSTVAGKRAKTSSATGAFDWYDRPKSPLTACERKSAYWTRSGRSSPSSCRSRATDSASARIPSFTTAGSPPAECNIRKTISEIPIRIGIARSTRRSRYVSIGEAAPVPTPKGFRRLSLGFQP
jgi:hypothetical protein